MNYIGSKYKLIEFIKSTIYSVVGNDIQSKVFCDLFAGTGIVARSFKKEVKHIISNDIEYYSYVLNKNYIGNHLHLPGKEDFINYLNNIELKEGFIFNNYCLGGGCNRQYFSDFNGKKIDAIRLKINEFIKNKEINKNMYYFLLSSLLESADKVANTASVYGAYLKKLKKTAQKNIILESAEYIVNENEHIVYNEDSNELIKKIEGDILYLDPPYNTRQYGANYHILNTIAKYDDFEPIGKTGLRKYYKSKYCSKNTIEETFNDLIKNANFKYIFLSYNNEGLMPVNKIRTIMSKYGNYDYYEKSYLRFRADKEENRNHKANYTKEFIHILEKK